jgi:DNA-binding NarL/FixJ family response regulator
LTVTEQNVAHLVATGSSNADIAAELLISKNTVVTHVSSILRKLGVSSRAAVVRAMAQHAS